MKLRNRIMSWILSPGAFALWHALGDPEEWHRTYIGHTACSLAHKTTGLHINMMDNCAGDGPPYFLAAPILFIMAPFLLDCEGEYRGAIGYFERHLIAGRAYRTFNAVRKQENHGRRAANRAVFAKLMVNQ